jgi:zinc protease
MRIGTYSLPLPALLLIIGAALSGAARGAEPSTRPLPKPAALKAKPFRLPKTQTLSLSNGLKVIVALNDEIPLWSVRLAFRTGGYADPVGKEGLASVTLAMLANGAGGLSAEEIARQMKQLGSSVGGAADDDGAQVAATGLTRNLDATLDVWAKLILSPDFPEADWKIMQARRVADLAAQRDDPTEIASRAARHLLWGDQYRGRLGSEAALQSITTDDMRKFWAEHFGPNNAIVLVGGSVNPKEIAAKLEARLAGWRPQTAAAARPEPQPVAPASPALYLIDKPGAAQSVIRVARAVPGRLSPDYYALAVGTEAIGTFTGRLNMNLREDKGWTYGASCGTGYGYGPGTWRCGTSVRTDATGPALAEIRKELTAIIGDRPISDDEVAYRKSSDVLGFPGGFENTGAILDQREAAWRYDLPGDWVNRYVPGIKAVDTKATNAAASEYFRPEELTWLVVGDAAVIRPGLEDFNLPIVQLDRDGNPIKGN